MNTQEAIEILVEMEQSHLVAAPQMGQPALARAAALRLAVGALGDGWIDSRIKPHPDKPGLKHYEQIPCLVVHRKEVRILQWNCEHQVWDDESGDDYYCDAKEVSYWRPLPPKPEKEN